MSTSKAVKCKICGKKYVNKQALIDHIDRSHQANIPEGWNAARYENFLRTGKTEGHCVYCHKVTGWNDATGKYNRMCGSEKCKKIARDRANKNYIGLHGKPYSINDPEQQKKMVYGRKNSGKYVFEGEDGKKYIAMYDSSYGKDFFEMIDTFLNWDGSDIIAPSPHTYWYEYEGKKHFYIPDAYSTSLNLEIELKDGGDNPNKHPKIQAVDKVKEQKKDEVMNSLKDQVNYIKICNKDYTGFFAMLSELKKKDVCPLPKWEGKLESVTESFYTDEPEKTSKIKRYHFEKKKLKYPGGWDKELEFTDLDSAIKQELSHLALNTRKGGCPYYVYARDVDGKAVLLGKIIIKWYDYWDHIDPQYEYYWDEEEDVDYDTILTESTKKGSHINLSQSFLKRHYNLKHPMLNYDDLMDSYRKKLFHQNLKESEWQSLYNELINVRDYLTMVVNGQSDEDKRMNYEASKALKQVDSFIQYMEDKNSTKEPITESFIMDSTDYKDYMINGNYEYTEQRLKTMNSPIKYNTMKDIFNVKYGIPENMDKSTIEKQVDSVGEKIYKKYWSKNKGTKANMYAPFKFYSECRNLASYSNIYDKYKSAFKKPCLYFYNFEKSGRRYSVVIATNDKDYDIYLINNYDLHNISTQEKINECLNSYTGVLPDLSKYIRDDSVMESSNYNNIRIIKINDPIAEKYLKHGSGWEYIDELKRQNTGEFIIDTASEKIVGGVFVGTTKDKGFISNLWVSPKYRKQGYGSRLLNDAINKYGGYDLTVKKNNHIALNMYKKRGFVAIKFKNSENNPYYWMKLKSKLTSKDKIVTESVTESKQIFEPGDFAEYKEFGDLDAARRPIEESVSTDKIPIYIIAYRYRSPFGAMVRLKTHSDFNHVALALSDDFEHAYTFSRRTDIDNRKMGFTEEPLSYMVKTDNSTKIKILRVYISKRSYSKLEGVISEYITHKDETKFNWGGMIDIVHKNGIDNDDLNDMSMVCSSFVDYALKEAGVDLTRKPNSNLVTPEDLASSENHNRNVSVVYQGYGRDYTPEKLQSVVDSYINFPNEGGEINMEATGTTLNNIIDFNAQTNVMEYIVPNNGNIIYNVTDESFVNYYKLLTPAEFKKWNGGVCWDYVVYEADYFKKHFKNVKYETFFHCFIDGKTNPTHTFLLFYLNGKTYWFESSWKSHVGIREFSNKDTALSFIVDELAKDIDHPINNQVTMIYNALNPKMFGMTCAEYMEYMNTQKEIHFRTIRNPKCLNYYRGKEAFDINQYATTEATNIEATKDDTKYYPVFIFLSYTGTNMAKVIKAFTHDPYAHSSLSFDTELNHMISFNRDGMVDENIFESVYKKNAANIRYSLYVYMATADEYEAMKDFVNTLLGKRSKLKYNLLGLTNFIFGRGSEREDKFFCSEFVASVISAGNNKIFKTRPYMTSPYMLAKNKNFVFIKTGILKNYDSKVVDKIVAEKLEEGGFTNVTFE